MRGLQASPAHVNEGSSSFIEHLCWEVVVISWVKMLFAHGTDSIKKLLWYTVLPFLPLPSLSASIGAF